MADRLCYPDVPDCTHGLRRSPCWRLRCEVQSKVVKVEGGLQCGLFTSLSMLEKFDSDTDIEVLIAVEFVNRSIKKSLLSA